MKRHFPTGWAILLFAILAVLVSLHFFPPREFGRLGNVMRMRNAPSDLYAFLSIRYDHPPIYQETYEMRDRNGISTFQYAVRSYAGRQITIKAPPQAIYDVSFFFGKLVNDGVWDIPNRPPRGNTSVHYTVTVRQRVDFRRGAHSAAFTDPQYWAKTAGREYQIQLSPNKPVPNLLQLRATILQDPRYQQIVDDFRAFGPPAFRSNVEKARVDVRKGH